MGLAFESLSDKLQNIFKNLRGKGRLTEEDVKTFNPDGKEIVAKENEISALRNEDLSKAYFSCHTDIFPHSVFHSRTYFPRSRPY